MDYKKIDIPFGAFDSELVYQEINIPDGFEVTIKGNKIILEKAESENERIKNLKENNVNYEKKYKEVLERAKRELQACGSQDCDAARQIFRFFPELAESEDEKIRKDLKRAISVALDYSYFDKKTANNCVTWLEKQSPKSKWTEEDESKVEDIMYFLNTAKTHYASTMAIDDCITWIKSLEQRMERQQ